MRLIDADALTEEFKKWLPKEDSEWLQSSIHPLENLSVSAILTIEEQPTVEAKEVVHAKWIDGCCSNCGAYVPTDSRIDFIDEEDCKFCYECGARMVKDNE